MPPERPFVRKAASWLLAVLGLLAGFAGLSISGVRWIPDPKTNEYWLGPWVRTGGIGLLGIVFLSASIVALKRRVPGALIFLICGPILVFCLAFPDTGYLKWDAQGNGIFYSPFPSTAIGLSLLFFAPFVLPLLVIRNRKCMLYVFLISLLVACPILAFSQWSPSLIPRLAAWVAPFVFFGLFWLVTGNRGWPPVVVQRSQTLTTRLLNVLGLFVIVVVVDVFATFALSAWWSSTWTPDCGGRRLFTEPVFPDHSVFTARLILVGHTSSTVFPAGMVGDWAIGVVEDRFWGLPRWSHFVLLTNHVFWKHQTYFIDGRRAHGLLTRFLPIVEAGPCARSRPLVDAALELRVLHERAPASGPRIIGFVRKPEPFTQGLTSPVPHQPFAGAKITISGKSGETVAKADDEGIYEVDGLPPDDYAVTVDLPSTQVAQRREVKKEDMAQEKLIEVDFLVDWDGTIEGVVKDPAGRPAAVWLQIQNPDGTMVGPGIQGLGGSRENGSFAFTELPAGRYVLMADPDGPRKEWPYAPLYYPTALRAADAHVFEIAEGQHIRNIVFTIGAPLSTRTVKVRVKWPNGQVAEGASVYVVYERTREYDDPRGRSFEVGTTDQSGELVVSLFGNSRVRIYASQSIDDLKGPPWFSHRFNVPLEFEADKVPDKLDLVLSSSDLSQYRNSRK